ncbi:MAG: YraN family protein [Anaerolineae bacterium]|nr:YraN family protein [Anaerolineae bacterium]MDW8170956.1 YraN family protein [Anaerolineae bacterium]
MSSQKHVGQQGESIAVQHLEQKQYLILARNWRHQHGEIDIIAWHNDVLVFAEVKTRRSSNTDDSLPNFTPRKRTALLQAIYHYLDQHQISDVTWRLDLIAVAIPPQGQPLIDHLEDALEW